MTVSYQYEVASSTSGGFTRLLFMWKGSLYKLIYRELLLFLAAFGLLSALYRNTFNSDQRRIFEKMVMYCDTFINLIPLSFVLGFYVAYVAGRWWQQYMAIPWPDKIMHSIALYVSGSDDHARMVRRTLMRYLNLTLILVLRSISSAVKRRFPTLDHVVESGFMTTVELDMFQSVPSVEFNTYWIPCTWFISLLKDCKRNNQIEDSQGLHIIMEEFNEFRSKCGLLWSYDWVSIPLVYTQVVTIATYSFFLAALVGRQYVDAAKKPLQMEIDIYLPVFTILQFFFFMGLLKVAEQLINPFGDDDEDFELNWLIDRHTKVSYLGVDILMSSAPPLVKDMYFDQVDLTLPYTEASVAYKKKTYRGSVHNMTSSFPSTQSFNKTVEMDPELKSGSTSSQHLEMCVDVAALPQEQKDRGVDVIESGSTGEGKTIRSLSRSESVPAKRPVFMTKSMLGWPSSSTLGHSDASLQCSQQSIEMQSYYNSSNFGINIERKPEDGVRTHNYQQEISARPAPVARRIRGDSFSDTGIGSSGRSGRSGGGGGGGGGDNGCGIGGGNGGESGRCSGGSGCGRDAGGGSGEIRSMDDSDGVGGRCGSVNDNKVGRNNNDGFCRDDHCISNINEVSELSHVENKRLNLNVDITYNCSPHLSQISLETPTIPKQYEHYICKPKDDNDYVTFKKDFRSACLAKVKSCPKLVFVKRQHSANNGRKKGVRWKPMVNNIPDRDGSFLRRQTVEILPVTPDSSGAHVFSNRMNAGELECMNESIPNTHCLWCRKQNEYRQALLKCPVKVDSEQFVNTSADSVSNSSFTQELCPLHYKINTSESDKSSAVPSSRLVIGSDVLHSTVSRSLPFQERRATVSTLSLTGSEWEAKRWQSRSFWERGFFKKMKLLYNRKGVKAVPAAAAAKRTNLFISNKSSLSQSLPNIPFPHSQSDSLKLAPELLTPMLMNRVMPTVRISDMTSTESEGSSCFASIMEMQEEDQSKRHDHLSDAAEESKKIPMISLNLLVGSSEFTSNSVTSLSNNSGEHLNTGSQDSPWQSADWTGIINIDLKGTSTSRDDAEQTTTPKEDRSVSSLEQINACASNTLQEVVVDNSNDSQFEKQSNKTVL